MALVRAPSKSANRGAGSRGSNMVSIDLLICRVHAKFWEWNSALNHQMEQQVSILEQRRDRPTLVHLKRLRKFEVKLSDTEAILYGTVFILLIGLILFNLWFATQYLEATPGAIFSIVSYTWEFAEAALALPVTLQSWSRLSEITSRLKSA